MTKMNLFKKCILLTTVSMSLSCDNENAEYGKEIDIKVLVISDVKEIKKKITTDVQDLFWFIENEKCKDTAFIPKITITRLGLKEEKTDSLNIPLSAINKFKSSFGTLRPNNILADYKEEVPNLKLPDFLFVPIENTSINIENTLKKYSIDYKYVIDSLRAKQGDVFYSIKSIREDIASNICDFKKSTFTILYDATYNEVATDTLIASGITKELQRIIDTSKSDEERLLIAEEVWEHFFTKNAYINRYDDVSGKVILGSYEPGQGKAYFINRIALIESIEAINILRTEFSTRKGEEDKISGLHLVEKHYATEMFKEE